MNHQYEEARMSQEEIDQAIEEDFPGYLSSFKRRKALGSPEVLRQRAVSFAARRQE